MFCAYIAVKKHENHKKTEIKITLHQNHVKIKDLTRRLRIIPKEALTVH